VYQLKQRAVPPEYLTELEQGILQSPEIGPSPLGEEFVRTLGFSVVFQRSAFSEVLAHYPWLGTFLDRAAFAATNAFYVNPLVLKVGSRVDAHADSRTLVHQNVRIVPTLVSVLYARCDGVVGGALRLGVGTAREVRIQPNAGDLLHFRGGVVHSVSEVREGGPRISLVCEQYNLSDQLLMKYPEFLVI
jgi:hypothetical protein